MFNRQIKKDHSQVSSIVLGVLISSSHSYSSILQVIVRHSHYTQYSTSDRRKCLSLLLVFSMPLSQGHAGTRVKQTVSKGYNDKCEPCQPKAAISLPLISVYFILFCAFLKNKGILWHDLSTITQIREFNIAITLLPNSQSTFKSHHLSGNALYSFPSVPCILSPWLPSLL